MTAKRKSFSAKERAEIFRDAGGMCHLCKRKIARKEAWEVEHIIALGLGGTNARENLWPAHVDCHRGKTKADVKGMRKADRVLKKDAGLTKAKRPLQSRGFTKKEKERPAVSSILGLKPASYYDKLAAGQAKHTEARSIKK